MKKCPNCGFLNPDEARTCRDCSYTLAGVRSTSETAPNEQQPQTQAPVRQQHTGFFANTQQAVSEQVYQTEVKRYIAKKDGKIHVLMINSFSKWLNQLFGVESKYTVQIDNILTAMQADGYEIVDVKFSTEQNQGMFGDMEGFYTMILYK